MLLIQDGGKMYVIVVLELILFQNHWNLNVKIETFSSTLRSSDYFYESIFPQISLKLISEPGKTNFSNLGNTWKTNLNNLIYNLKAAIQLSLK